MRYELTDLADKDIEDILSDTAKMFGPRQLATYAKIIDHGIAMIADDPFRGGSIDCRAIRPDVRLFHLELSAKRRGGAAHCLYYKTGRLSDGIDGVLILRVLHEHMHPRLKIIRSLNDRD
ncbi:MAG TPA: type II toxin-antitoxin system RelE/ParE family toxin [Telmatospirillum sp.]|nr:type II toxin-antitoxin system RelE/ParE family toxin [Telmatospirillum sp.]